MKIKYLQISNILSFKYYADVAQATKVTFNGDLNILIGQNGSGKSTALEIINFIFKRVLFVQPNFNDDVYSRISIANSEEKKDVLTIVDNKRFKEFRLDPNWASEDKEQKIVVEIELDEIDAENISNIEKNIDKLQKIASIYTRQTVTSLAAYQKIITIEITLSHNTNTFIVNVLPSIDTSGYQYLSKYKFYNEIISLHNAEFPENYISQLYESFILISSFRNYHTFTPSISLQRSHAKKQIKQIHNNELNLSINTSEQAEPAIFSLVRLIVAEEHYKMFDSKLDNEECERKANEMPFLKSINEKLKLIDLKCKIKLAQRRTWEYSFEFNDIKRNRILTNINSLSAGQKAIIHLIFEAYGRGNLKGGLIIIDEPEIHLHYQFQNEYLNIIREINTEKKCQYILVTHSESLINSETISKVKRFSLTVDCDTVIKSPTLSANQKSLIKILDNTRSIYAFFARKVILAEGDTDRYLFKEILNKLYPGLIQEIAILDIGGKGNYLMWRDFFESFGLNVYYIGDFDNVFTMQFMGKPMIDRESNEVKRDIKQFKLNNLDSSCIESLNRKYNELITDVNFIKKPNLNLWKPMIDLFFQFINVSNKEVTKKIKEDFEKIDSEIENKYSENVFILKSGSIEEYVATQHGRLESVIEFCNKGLDDWLMENGDNVFEIKRIMELICN